MRARTIASATLLGLVLPAALPTRARAQENLYAPRPNAPRVTPWETSIAYRGAWFESPGYQPFATTDRFAQVTLGASRAVISRGRFALTVGAAWDYGNTGATARGASTYLELQRVTVPITLRFALTPWVDLFARVAPGAAHVSANVDEPSALAPLATTGWLASGDATLGASWAFASWTIAEHSFVARVTGEGGYGWTADMALSLAPDLGGGDPRLTGTTELGSVSLSGGFGRLGLALGF
jgi:hypothetical protein